MMNTKVKEEEKQDGGRRLLSMMANIQMNGYCWTRMGKFGWIKRCC